MAVCNIFNRLRSNTGTYFMFSQYAEDLTRESVQSSYYRVTPSKFIALELDVNEYNDDTIARLLQNKFENGCAVCRKEMVDTWVPSHSTNLFWDTLFNAGLLSIENSFVKEIRYVGDINLQSYNEHDGIGYSELYCYIPNEAPNIQYQCSIDNKDNKYFVSSRQLEGYNYDDLDRWVNLDEIITYYPEHKYEFPWSSNTVTSQKTQDSCFKINTIITLYDIYTNSENNAEPAYSNVPMGIYFTGLIEEGSLTNSITKYVSNPDIFGAGTSYGLRICSRFIVSPNQNNIKILDTTTENDNYSAISQVMAQMAISQTKMDEVLTKIQSNSSAEKELLSIFKNSKTNVPYIKMYNGTSHWFVNGKNLGPVLETFDCECIPYDTQEILDALNKSHSLVVSLHAANSFGRYIFDKSVDPAQDILLTWDIMFNEDTVIPDSLYLNELEIDKNNTSITMSGVSETITYKLSAEKEGLVNDATSTIHFVWPTFFGTMPCDHTCGNRIQHTFNPNPTDIKRLTKYVRTSKNNEFTYTNFADATGKTDHVVIAYPCEFGELYSISDEFNYEYIDDFIKYRKVFTFDNNLQAEYFVYVDKIPAEVENFKIRFK